MRTDWSLEELEQLTNLYKNNTVVSIAKLLKRTRSSVANKIFDLKLIKRPCTGPFLLENGQKYTNLIFNMDTDGPLPKISCIYLITNIINNKLYIGQAENFRRRIYYHLFNTHKKYKTTSTPIANAILLYGPSKFEIQILEECIIDKLDERETHYITSYNTLDKSIGYNILLHGFNRRGTIHTEETRRKISESCKKSATCGDAHWTKKDPMRNISKAHIKNTGAKRSIETVEKISIAQKGRKNEWCCKQVKQIDLISNEIICVWESVASAARHLNKKNPTGIFSVCNKRSNNEGRIQKTAYGFKWEWVV